MRLSRAFALSKSFILSLLEDKGKISFREYIFTRIFALKNWWLKNIGVEGPEHVKHVTTLKRLI